MTNKEYATVIRILNRFNADGISLDEAKRKLWQWRTPKRFSSGRMKPANPMITEAVFQACLRELEEVVEQ